MDALRHFFEQLAQEWDSFQPADRDVVLNNLLAPFDAQIRLSQSILDVGTGTGAIIPVLRQRYPTARITSIDLATEMLVRAKSRVPSAGLIQADVHCLPFARKSFSTVICHNSLPHFQDKQNALKEIRQVLQEDGWVYLLHDLSREQVNSIHQNAQAEIIHQDVLPIAESLCQMLEAAGFEPVCVEDTAEHYVISARSRPLIIT